MRRKFVFKKLKHPWSVVMIELVPAIRVADQIFKNIE